MEERLQGGWLGSGCCEGVCRHSEMFGASRAPDRCASQTLIHKTPRQPLLNPRAQQKSWGLLLLEQFPPQAGLALVIGFVPPGAACTPSHHPAGQAPHASAAWGPTCWELLPAKTCALYQLAIDLEKFMALASHGTFTRKRSFPQMM